jgi:hypothetical protein
MAATAVAGDQTANIQKADMKKLENVLAVYPKRDQAIQRVLKEIQRAAASAAKT